MSELEPDRETQEAWLAQFSRFALDEMGRVAELPAHGNPDMSAAAAVSVPIPETPLEGGVDRILDVLGRAAGLSLNTPGPGYLAYVPGGGLYGAALADFVANCLNRYTGLSLAAPGLCRLEQDVLAWLAREFGYGPEARGLMTTGGSLANLAAIVTARHEKLGETGEYGQAIAYTSRQVHHSVAKSLAVAGIPRRNLREVATDPQFRLDPEDLARQVRADRAAGARPFLVVASAGTTNTGAIDPLPALADLCGAEDLWLHVDGAYGGAFALCPEGRARMPGLERADSIVFDPHKGMFLPYGTGTLLVRDGAALRRAHHESADYLQDFPEGAEQIPSPTEYGPELSRDFRGLRVWLPLMLHGAGAFRRALTEKLELTERFHRGLAAAIEDGAPLEIVAAPQLSAMAFRLRPEPGESVEEADRRNADLLARVNARGRVYLSSTRLADADGQQRFTPRICILSFRTHAEHVDAGLDDLLSEA